MVARKNSIDMPILYSVSSTALVDHSGFGDHANVKCKIDLLVHLLSLIVNPVCP